MLPARASRVISAWFAVVALLVAALAPALSHAVSARAAISASDVCRVDDSVRGDATPAPHGGAHPFEHCPYCTLHADGVALPPAAPAGSTLRLDLGDGLPVAFLAAPRTLHAWVSAQPRAPPRFV